MRGVDAAAAHVERLGQRRRSAAPRPLRISPPRTNAGLPVASAIAFSHTARSPDGAFGMAILGHAATPAAIQRRAHGRQVDAFHGHRAGRLAQHAGSSVRPAPPARCRTRRRRRRSRPHARASVTSCRHAALGRRHAGAAQGGDQLRSAPAAACAGGICTPRPTISSASSCLLVSPLARIGHQLAPAQHHHAVRYTHHFVELVADEDHRQPFGHQLRQRGEQAVAPPAASAPPWVHRESARARRGTAP